MQKQQHGQGKPKSFQIEYLPKKKKIQYKTQRDQIATSSVAQRMSSFGFHLDKSG